MTKPKQPWRCQKCGCHGVAIPREHPRSRLCAWCAEELAAAGLRWCGGCKTGKPPADFTSRYVCRDCNSARNRAWREQHADAVQAHNQAYHEQHRDEMIAYRRSYYRANRAKLLAQKKAYYQQNAERIIADQRERRRRGISEASKLKARRRHQMKRHIYKRNEKIACARRLLKVMRGEA